MDIRSKLFAYAILLTLVGACSTNTQPSTSSSPSVLSGGSGEKPELAVEFVDSGDYVFSSSDRTKIREIAEAALRDIRPLLEGEPARIELIVRAGTFVIPETGEGGAALAPGRIGWTVDWKRPGGPVAIASARLRSTLFHEVHHLARGWTITGGTSDRRLIDAAVAEGLATAFERDAAHGSPPWGIYPKDANLWSEELIDLPADASYGQWMFQHSDGRRWIGYRAGTYLADRAIAASGRSAAELVAKPTEEILNLAGCTAPPARCGR